MMSSSPTVVYRFNQQLPPNAKCKPSNNNVASASKSTATPTAARANRAIEPIEQPAKTTTIRRTSAAMQQPHQLQPHQQQQQPSKQLANNIIVLRGSRNENGQIVIQNKHDIISFINEQQQHQQQQQQNAKVTATLTQLPTATTVARKTIQQPPALASGLSTSCISLTAANNGRDNGNSKESNSNTILLQTPINASQLESVLLQSAHLKKQAANASSGSTHDRPYLFKTASRSLSTDSNRLGSADSSSKAPFVLQTLKRLEKSQSILVIRNSAGSSSSSNSNSNASTLSSASSTSLSVNNIAHASTSTSIDRKSITTPTLLLSNGGSATSLTLSTAASNNNNNSSSVVTPATVSVSTNTQTGALSFTRTTKSQQTNTTTTTKLGQIVQRIAKNNNNNNTNHHVAGTTNNNNSGSNSNNKATVATTTTTYLRLTNAITTVFANNANNNNNNNNSNHGQGQGQHINGNNKNLNANNNNSHNSTNVVVTAASVSASNNNHNNSNNSNNNGNGNNGKSTNNSGGIRNTLNMETQLSLADVQLKQERTPTTLQHLHLQQQQQQQQITNAPLGNDGEPIKLPDNLESLPRADSFPSQRHRWNTNEEIAAILISFDKHSEWQSKEVRTRPKSGSLLLYSRKKVRYRRDGYCWKKRKDGKTTREDHMKLKVQGTECIYGCYVHSAILPTFHRRCYWLLQNPDIVLVHYLNVPYPDDNKMAVIAPSITLWGDKKEWTKEELVSQLRPMLSTVTSDDDSDSGNDIEISAAETVESIVCQLMEKQRLSRQAALVKQLDCGCGDASCADGKTCSHPVMRRPSLLKSVNEKRVSLSESYNQSGSGTPNVVVGQKLYSRWSERRLRDSNSDAHHPSHHHQYQALHQTLPQETAIKFQIIPPGSEQQPQQHTSYQSHYRQHGNSNNNNNNNNNNNGPSSAHQLLSARNNLILQQQQQQQHHSNFNQSSSSLANNNQLNLQRFVANQNSNSNNSSNNANNNNSQINHRLQIAKTTITATTAVAAATTTIEQHIAAVGVGGGGGGGMNEAEQQQLIGNPNRMSTNSNASHGLNRNSMQHNNHNNSNTSNSNSNNSNTNNNQHEGSNSSSQLTLTPQQQQQQQQAHQQAVINNNSNYNYNSQQQQQMNTSTSLASTITQSTQARQEFYKLQQQQQQTTNDIKLSSSSSQLQSQQSHIQQQLQQQQQQHQHQSLSTNSNMSTVEPMCMSPEHHPSTPIAASTANLSNTLNGNSNNNEMLQQQQTTQHITSSPAMSTTSTISSLSAATGAVSSSLSSSPISAGSTQSSSHSIMDDNVAAVGHHKQQQQQQQSTNDALDENLITTHAHSMGDAIEVDVHNGEAVEMSSSSDLKQILSTSNHSHPNNGNNSNNQSTEYNNSNTSTDGCVNNMGASSDSATVSNCDTTQESHHHHKSHTNNSNTTTLSFDGMDLHNTSASANAEQQQQQQHPSHQQTIIAEHSAHELHDSLSFLNDTLDLSQEDIQRTLIANMPFGAVTAASGGVSKNGDTSHVLHSIDFLSSHCPVTQSDDELLVPGVVSCEGDDDGDADDVFANFDAFDMLVEFPELDLDDKEALTHTALEQQHQQQQHENQQQLEQNQQPAETPDHHQQQLDTPSLGTQIAELQQYDKKYLSICDYSPEWSYTEGGVKVLIAGPWTSNANYTVLFDAQPVSTELVQEGVLRCYSPAHEVGFASLQVSCEGFVISNAVMFEYKMSLCQEVPFDASSNDCLYKFTLLNRLLSIEEKMQVKTDGTNNLFDQQSLFLQTHFEEKLVSYCQQLMKRSWLKNNSGSNWNNGFRGMTLLHLAAALGYTKLVCAMLNWRAENPNIILETEMDALSQDVRGYTPMAWACARGYTEVVNVLYKWNHNALKIKNHTQQTPFDIAHCKGHKSVLSELYRLEHERHKQNKSDALGSLALGLNKYSVTDLHTKSLSGNDQLYDVKDNENLFNSFDALDVQRSHDGVFLRPIAVASNQSPPNSSRFSKRSSVDSGINMDVRTKPGKSFKDITRLQSFEAHDSFSLGVESPLDALTAGNTTNSLLSPSRKMDFALCEVSTGDSSPLPDKDHDDTSTINNDDITDVTINTETDGIVGDSDAKVLTLAEHIIAAMPEHIKNEADELMVLGSPLTEPLNSDSPGLNNVFMDPLDTLPHAHFESFDFNDHAYRYHEVGTPCSSLSPASSGPLQSPASYSILGADPAVSSPSPPPSTKQLTEFLHASSSNQYPFEADFSKLTLTDTEQRELYEAAKCIQKAYRSYKGRQKLEEQNKERTAAIVIQNYYRRYKQYAYYRQMTNAALVIQHGYRSYCRNKRFKKSQSSTSTGIELSNADSLTDSPNSQCLSSFYDHFKNDQQQHEFSSQPSTPKETSPSGPLKRTYSQSTQNQAARKIQQFMRQSRIKLQRERAEKEKLVHQRRAEYLQSLQYRGQQEIACQQEKNELETTELVNSTKNTTFNFTMNTP